MRLKFILVVLFFILLTTIGTETKGSLDPTRTVITGQILNFNKLPDYNSLELSIPDVLAQNIHMKETISSTGQFKFVFDLDNTTNIWLRYKNNFPVFISPGDSIHLKIDNGYITTDYKNDSNLYSYLKVSGNSVIINKEVSRFLSFFEDSVYHSWAINDSLKKYDAIAAKEFLVRELERQYVALEMFNGTNNTSEQFKVWAQNHLKYRTWSILFQYPAFHVFLNGKEKPKNGYFSVIPKEYFNFLDSFENFRNNELFETKNYTDFLRGYIGYLKQLIPQDTTKYYRSLYATDFEKGFNFFCNYYTANYDGFLKDLLVSNHYYWTLDDGYYNKLKYIVDFQQITDEELKRKVEEKFYFEQKIYEDPSLDPDSKINELVDANEFLVSLKNKYKGKVIYIDFWAPWCKPCMAEMPFAKDLKMQFENKDVAFVYLGTNCKKESWEKTIEEQEIKGEHYLLTEKQSKDLGNTFDIRGIPHFVLLNKAGNVERKFAPRPSSGEVLINLINENLKTGI